MQARTTGEFRRCGAAFAVVGPATPEAANALARHAAASGIVKAIVTPHIFPRRYGSTLSAKRNA